MLGDTTEPSAHTHTPFLCEHSFSLSKHISLVQVIVRGQVNGVETGK